MTYSLRLSRGFTVAFLTCVYILGFLITPYWILPQSTTGVILHLILIISVGTLWLVLSSGILELKSRGKDVGLFFLLLVGIVALNYRALNSVIPFRGDEALHIERTLELMDRIPLVQGLVIVTLFLIFLVAGVRNQRWVIFIGLLIAVCVIFYFLGNDPFEDMAKYPLFFLRYPFINYWFFAIFPRLTSFIASPYHEALYRIVPIISMVGISWIYQKNLGMSNLASGLAWGLGVATIPLVFYYASILYIEPLAVFLMMVVCLDINHLMHKSRDEISQTPGWYALILIGFIKETTIPFLLCFLAIRIVIQLQAWLKTDSAERSTRIFLHVLAGELGIIFSLLAPVLLYLYFRATLTSTRTFAPHLSNLFNLTNYHFVVLSFVEQFGLFLLFFLAGCILLIRNREFTPLFCYIFFLLAVLAFHIMDYEVYAGYSRFNLFVLPPILAGSARFIAWIAKQKQYIGSALVIVAVAGNLLLSPVNLDGVKTPFWGSYRIDDSEHYYPYQDALLWLKNHHPEKRILFTGLDFYYPFQFYWNKLGWKPRRDGIRSEENIDNEALAISRILEKAEREHYRVVVYRVIGKEVTLPKETREFDIQVVKNSAHTLIIFYK